MKEIIEEKKENQKGKVLNSNAIKLIAIICMTIDHIAWAVFPGYSLNPIAIVMHVIGRITCPVMCFFIAEGFHYTKDVNKYTLRLFIFAFISHFAYVFASNDFIDARSFIPFFFGNVFNQTGVLWPLAWGLVMLRVYYTDKIKSTPLKVILILLICAVTFPSDWSCVASLCVFAIGINRGSFKKQCLWTFFYVFIYAAVYFFALDKIYGLIQLGVVLSFPLWYLYSGKRGTNEKFNKAVKWLFYVYYPLHLTIIGLCVYFL